MRDFYHDSHVQAMHKRIAILEQRIFFQDMTIRELEKQNMRLLDTIFKIEEFWCWLEKELNNYISLINFTQKEWGVFLRMLRKWIQLQGII